MDGRWYACVVLMLCLLNGCYSAKKKGAYPQSGNNWETPYTNTHSFQEHSGTGPGDDEDEYQGGSSYFEGSADDDDEEGSGFEVEGSAVAPLPAPTRVLTVCEKLRQRLELVPAFDGAYVPRCTNTGDFQPMQCATHNAACWCVDRNGDEIHGTRRRSPNRPDCSLRARDAGTPVGVGVDKDGVEKLHRVPVDHNDFEIDKVKEELSPDITETQPDDEDRGHGGRVGPSREESQSSLVVKPGLLAGIIGGAIVGLLCAVLLAMFIVYRMRKKDEGSYPLDEPKKPLNYTKTQHSQEYFA